MPWYVTQDSDSVRSYSIVAFDEEPHFGDIRYSVLKCIDESSQICCISRNLFHLDYLKYSEKFPYIVLSHYSKIIVGYMNDESKDNWVYHVHLDEKTRMTAEKTGFRVYFEK